MEVNINIPGLKLHAERLENVQKSLAGNYYKMQYFDRVYNMIHFAKTIMWLCDAAPNKDVDMPSNTAQHAWALTENYFANWNSVKELMAEEHKIPFREVPTIDVMKVCDEMYSTILSTGLMKPVVCGNGEASSWKQIHQAIEILHGRWQQFKKRNDKNERTKAENADH